MNDFSITPSYRNIRKLLFITLLGGYSIGTSLSQDTNIRTDFYKLTPICNVEQRIRNGCMVLANNSTRKLGCVSMCQEKYPTCERAVLNRNGSCYYHYDCSDVEKSAVCTSQDALYSAFQNEQICLNGGTRNGNSDSCQCANDWKGENCEIFDPYCIHGERIEGPSCNCAPSYTGVRCDQRFESCYDLRQLGIKGTILMNVNYAGNLLESRIKCLLSDDVVATYVSTSTGILSFNSTYQEYKDGFFHDHSSSWLGLDNLHQLTMNKSVKFVIHMLRNSNFVTNLIYTNFYVKGETENYAVMFDSSRVDTENNDKEFGPCLEKNAVFSSWDRDLDPAANQNIAAEAGSGWWFGSHGNYCNVNGKKPVDESSVGPEFITLQGLDMSYNGLGKDFRYVHILIDETYP